jgi:nucleotide-binding universal stress UspA family protein
MIVICYDGSEDARAAIAEAATLMPGHPAVTLAVWSASEPADDGAGERDRTWAECTAAEGALRGHQAGIDCAPRVACHPGAAAEAIFEEARRNDARAIVVGRGGGDEAGECGLGPVPAALLREGDCPVLIAGPATDAGVAAGHAARTGVPV